MITEDSNGAEVPKVPRAHREVSPTTVGFVVLITGLVGYAFIGPLVGFFIAYPFYPDSKTEFQFLEDLADPVGKEYMKSLLWLIQGATTIGLGAVPAIFWARLRHRKVIGLVRENPVRPLMYLLTVAIVVFAVGPNSVFIEWNANVDLPDGGFENWAKDIEAKAQDVVKYMASFTNFGEYLLGVIVIGLLPGIAEELLFRGFLQPELQKMTGNVHAGIWMSAIFFSALHLQFYGFVPRVFLGAMFGYIYFWSGSLPLVMFAHFLNNALSVTALYLGLDDIPGVENDDSMPWWLVGLFTTLFGFFMYTMHNMFKSRATETEQYVR